MIPVTLRNDEMAAAVQGGGFRHIRALATGLRDKFDSPYARSFGPHVDGALAELAVAKQYGFYWSPTSVEDFKALDGDAGPLQVRSTTRSDGRLIVRPNDPDDRVFVFVVNKPPRFYLSGWLTGADAKRPEWARNGGEFFLVAPASLNPMGDLT